MLDPTTETKRGNFGQILSLVPRPCTTCVGWAWDHGFEMCESTLLPPPPNLEVNIPMTSGWSPEKTYDSLGM